MLFDLPDDEALYQALTARDPSYEGRAYVGVTSTGIFCRLTCPARKPKRENCQFYETIAACLEAGFRPCKRCHPMLTVEQADPAMTDLLDRLERAPDARWTERDIQRLGYDPSTVRRAFKRQFGMTFLDLARLRRLRHGFTTLAEGGRVIEAQIDAGFSSPSAFRAAFGRLLGCAPGAFEADALLRVDWIESPLGPMLVVADDRQVHLLEFLDRKALPTELKRLQAAAKGSLGFGRTDPAEQIAGELAQYFAGQSARFDTPLALHGSAFSREVWKMLQQIPAGETRSYGQLAREMGKPAATRAVARANGANQIAIAVPCHRVVGADGALVGYGGGLWRKHRLIEIEQQIGRLQQPA